MAKQVQVLILDDLDGSEAHETVSFALDGVSYEIDLSVANASALRESLDPFVQAARKPGRSAPAKPARAVRAEPDMSGVRTWAREHGFEVSDRGRIPQTVLTAYQEAHR